jgi:hypothetical protein
MIELDPRDRLPYPNPRKFPVFAMIGAIAVLGGGGFFYWQYAAQRSNYVEIYRRLGIPSLPATVELLPQVQSRLDQLSREPCYRAAIYALADALLEAGYPRETDTSLISFAKRCGQSDEILVRRYKALFRASDFSAALRVADDLVKSVAVTPAFASKARLNVETGTQLPMKTVGATAFADLAYATTVAVGKAEAQGVAVAVVRGAPDPFGDRLDGLLGRSFLARFRLNMSQSTIELTALPLR